MNRRDFLITALQCSLYSGIYQSSTYARDKNQRPAKNIIFISADQLSAAFIGCYGSNVPSTPTLDRLAKQGAQFTRYYAKSPNRFPHYRNMPVKNNKKYIPQGGKLTSERVIYHNNPSPALINDLANR